MNSNSMNVNLKSLREDLGLSQKEFANKLKVSDTTISKLEKGERNITDRMLIQICDAFNVRSEWLRTGEGNMYRTVSDLNIANMMGKVFADDDEFLKKVFLTFLNLSDEERAVIQKVINQLSEK